MRRAARVTLFIHDRDGRLDATPDLEVLYALLREVPLVNRNPDGSRTLVFDLDNPSERIGVGVETAGAAPDRLRSQIASLGSEARALGLTLTAALADAAEIVANTELDSPPPLRART